MDASSVAHAWAEAETGAAGPGLVSSQTSVPSPEQGQLLAFRHETRLRRLRESVSNAAGIHEAELQALPFRFEALFLTLTYAPGIPWAPRDISRFLKRLRAWYGRTYGEPPRYTWVGEIQEKRKAAGSEDHCVHYHVVIWVPKGARLPKPDESGWWPHGMTKIERARSPVGYLTKYASKGTSPDDIPKGARLHGCGGLSVAGRLERTWRMCPAWVREIFSAEDRPQRAPGGGWISKVTRRFEPSRWVMVQRARDWSWVIFGPRQAEVAYG